MAKDRLFVDIQFMQTGAFGRGMGQHVRALFKSAVKNIPNNIKDIYFLYSDSLPDENIMIFKEEMRRADPHAALDFYAVSTVPHNLERPGDYEVAYAHNKTALQAFYDSHSLGKDIWFVPCPMQEPVVPALPSSENLRTSVLWYDLMPYLMYKHYFADRSSPFAHSYTSRLALLPSYDHILVISENSKNDLVRYLSLLPEDITNVSGWVNEEIDGKGTLPAAINKPFILLNASPEPNKNAERAILAFNEFNQGHNGKYQLAVTSDYNASLKEMADKLGADVVFMGHIKSVDLKEVYIRSEALLFPSVYEGLGLPPLEAVNLGKKVVISDIPVLREIGGDDAFYWCDPYEVSSIARALDEAIRGGVALTAHQRSEYKNIKQRYSWSISAGIFWHQLTGMKKVKRSHKSIAIVGPHPNSFSSIGKFIVETYPVYARKYDHVDYYYDKGPSDKRHGQTRFNYIGALITLRPIQDLLKAAGNYDAIIYHMGNSDHHMATYLVAHKYPDTVVLHDTNLSGDGLAGQMLSNGFISKERVDAERMLETEYLKLPERFISSLLSVQKKVIVHSAYARQVAKDYCAGEKMPIIKQLEHPLRAVSYARPKEYTGRPLRLGIAGIMTEVKGVNVLDWLLSETDNLRNAELYIFGYGFFADKQALFDLAKRYKNIHVTFDLTDMEFNEAMSKLDILINYREVYKGEASRATLEAIRERVVPVVRKVGWYDELPDDTVYKLDTIEDMPALINHLSSGDDSIEQELRGKVERGQQLLKERFAPEDYVNGMMDE